MNADNILWDGMTADQFVDKMLETDQITLADIPARIANYKKVASTDPPEVARRTRALVAAYERKLKEAA